MEFKSGNDGRADRKLMELENILLTWDTSSLDFKRVALCASVSPMWGSVTPLSSIQTARHEGARRDTQSVYSLEPKTRYAYNLARSWSFMSAYSAYQR